RGFAMRSQSGTRPRYGLISCAIFLVAVAILLISSLFASALGQLSLTTQRWIGYLTLVLPALIGVILGGLGLRQHKKALAIVGLVLNTLFALYFGLLFSFAG
ncbi:MAG TPA: hypothetical protein VGD69_25565, partial [Herpetosiphonaceae bacterium]